MKESFPRGQIRGRWAWMGRIFQKENGILSWMKFRMGMEKAGNAEGKPQRTLNLMAGSSAFSDKDVGGSSEASTGSCRQLDG